MADQFRDHLVENITEYVSPAIVAAHGPDTILPALQISQAILSLVHPDQGNNISADETDLQVRSAAALSLINQSIGMIKQDDGIIDDVAEICELVAGNDARRLLTIRAHTEKISAIIGQVSASSEQNESSSSTDLVRTGESLHQNPELLYLIIGGGVLHLMSELKNAGVPNVNSWLASRLKQKLPRTDIDNPLGYSPSLWNQLFDEVDAEQVEISYSEQPLEHIVAEAEKEELERMGALIELLKPGEAYDYPEDWCRSYSGLIVSPTENWPLYSRQINEFQVTPEIGSIRVFDVDSGTVNKVVDLDPKERLSTTRLEDAPAKQRVFVKDIINKVAELIGYDKSKFVKKLSSGDGGLDTQLVPMDFIFHVGTDDVSILYTRPTHTEHSTGIELPSYSFSLDAGEQLPLAQGYYMVKAGKNVNTNKYRTSNTPLALIELSPQGTGNNKILGGAFVMQAQSSSPNENMGLISDIDFRGGSFTTFANRAIFLKHVKKSAIKLDKVISTPHLDEGGLSSDSLVFASKDGVVSVQSALDGHKVKYIKST